MSKATVVCPSCSSTSTHDHGFINGDGSTRKVCPQCRKTIVIYFRKGNVYKVTS